VAKLATNQRCLLAGYATNTPVSNIQLARAIFDADCRGCARELYPGYDVTPRSLHAVCGRQENSATFNPYHRKDYLNYVGNRVDDDEHISPWKTAPKF
jgi:hypothetical protein